MGISPGKTLGYLRRYGLKETLDHAKEKIKEERYDYDAWIRKREISSVQAGYQRQMEFSKMPLLWICILPQEDGSRRKELYDRSLQAVQASTYPRIRFTQAARARENDTELTADAIKPRRDAADVIKPWNDAEPDDYVVFLREGDMLTRDALFECVRSLQGGADALYADDDSYEILTETSSGGQDRRTGQTAPADREKKRFSDPRFKPDYSPEYLASMNYIGSFVVFGAGFLAKCESGRPVPGKIAAAVFGKGAEDTQDRGTAEEVLKADPSWHAWLIRTLDSACRAGGVVHIPKVLCHRLKGMAEKDEAGTGAQGAFRKNETDTGAQGAADGTVSGAPPQTCGRSESEPLVSIVIPNKDSAGMLRECIGSIREKTSWKNYEIIIAENNSKEPETKALYEELTAAEGLNVSVADLGALSQFDFSYIVNEGVKASKGGYIILMNNDVTVITPDWIERLLFHCEKEGVGAVGPKLLYPDGTVQSAGVVVGLLGFAGSMMVGEAGDDPGYMRRAEAANNMSAVTAACMMVSRKAFDEAGGFDTDLKVALNDVDFCLKLTRLGYRQVLEPSALLVHHESKTRGAEDTPEKKKRFEQEKALFRKKWKDVLKAGDPYYNPNLSQRKCDYSV